MKLRVITTECTNPYTNLAVEEYLTKHAAEGEVVLFLWQNAHTVVIGRNQNPWRECNVEKMKADDVYLARRMSGGGAVYHDLGNLNFTFIARDGLFDIDKQTDVVLLACRLLGVEAAKSGRNDLLVDGRKFSGHAYYSSKGHNYHHGTIMLDVIPSDMTKYLQASDAKLQSKGVESVRSRVTNLKSHVSSEVRKRLEESCLGRSVALVEEMKAAMIKAFERQYEGEAELVTFRELLVTDEVKGAATRGRIKVSELQKLIDKYSSDKWRLGTRIPFEKQIEHRFEWGEVEIQLQMKGGYIKDCRIYSDALDTEMFGALEQQLRGCCYDAAGIMALARPDGASASAHEILNLIAASVE